MHTTNTVLYIKASVDSMAGASFIHGPVRPVRGLYGLFKPSDTMMPKSLSTLVVCNLSVPNPNTQKIISSTISKPKMFLKIF